LKTLSLLKKCLPTPRKSGTLKVAQKFPLESSTPKKLKKGEITSWTKSNKNFHLTERYFPKGQMDYFHLELNSLEEAKGSREYKDI